MAAGKGNLVLLGIGTVSGETTTYANVMSARSNSFSINNEQVDVTNKGSSGHRKYLEGAGIQSMATSISGVFEDSATEDLIRAAAVANTFVLAKIVLSNGDAFAGSFAVTSYERAGEYNGEETYTVALESAGAVTFTAGV